MLEENFKYSGINISYLNDCVWMLGEPSSLLSGAGKCQVLILIPELSVLPFKFKV